MAAIHVRDLRKRFARKTVLDGVTFDVADGKFVTLLGSSGCGKTTTLRSVAGLERPDGGVIALGQRVVFDRSQDVPTRRRDVGMVFQSYALWPNMTVEKNVGYPLRVRSLSGAEVARRVAESLELVGLAELRRSYPYQLSGGQQQRVALARALVYEPKVMLLDEPLSNLDARLRAQLRLDIRRIQQTAGITALYVTHDRQEALSMSDSVCLMRDGRIVRQDTPEQMWRDPGSSYVARFLDAGVLLAADVVGNDGACAVLDVAGQRVAAAGAEPWPPGTACSLLLRNPRITMADGAVPAGVEVLQARCLVSATVGDMREAEYEIGGTMVRITSRIEDHDAVPAGELGRITFHRDAARVLRDE
ncbi:MAG TPA: ABC transporter ATP-binding protein [Pseudonocardiaceae bacterium]|nr:ABC transporter ATP-binding protein [Pseudonocardiaceae bacterium]